MPSGVAIVKDQKKNQISDWSITDHDKRSLDLFHVQHSYFGEGIKKDNRTLLCGYHD
jgi:hypothetical protein